VSRRKPRDGETGQAEIVNEIERLEVMYLPVVISADGLCKGVQHRWRIAVVARSFTTPLLGHFTLLSVGFRSTPTIEVLIQIVAR
jgi:hypothetical protein